MSYIINEDRIWLISPDTKSISLKFKIDGRIMISHVRHVLNALDPLCYYISMSHGNQRDIHATHLSNVWTPYTWNFRNQYVHNVNRTLESFQSAQWCHFQWFLSIIVFHSVYYYNTSKILKYLFPGLILLQKTKWRAFVDLSHMFTPGKGVHQFRYFILVDTYCCLLMHNAFLFKWDPMGTLMNGVVHALVHALDPISIKMHTCMHEQITMEFGVHIVDRKNLNWCIPLSGASLWSGLTCTVDNSISLDGSLGSFYGCNPLCTKIIHSCLDPCHWYPFNDLGTLS